MAYPYLMTGVSNKKLGPFALPLKLPVPMFTSGCLLYTSAEVTTRSPLKRDFRIDFRIPNDRNLIGAQFYQQWIIQIAICWGCGQFLSDAGHGVIGL